jgi:hypothetical protein
MTAPARLPAARDLILGADGMQRLAAEERRLNEAFAAAFAGEPGRAALDHLRAITVLNVAGPAISDAALRHLEGQRFLVALIQRRTDHGRNHEPKLADDAGDTAGRRRIPPRRPDRPRRGRGGRRLRQPDAAP